MAAICRDWLYEIEDASNTDRWEDRRTPFGVETISRDDWEETEKRLRRCLTMSVAAAPDVIRSYVERLIGQERLLEARTDVVKEPRQVPAILPSAFANLAISHFVPRRKRVRYDDRVIYPQCFSTFDYHHAGISHDTGFFPSSPRRAGFAILFEHDEAAALRLFHRLEMRASVFFRRYTQWNDRRRAIPLRLEMPWSVVPLWGDESVYRWSRGTLGSNVLGSAYLALDDWLNKAANAGRSLEELFQLVLQPNGLVATASVCINAIVAQINAKRQFDLAAPFLGALRLWDYDLRRYMDDRLHSTPLGFEPHDRFHYDAARQVGERYSKRQFLANELLLPFQLMASDEAREAFQRRRNSWSASDFAGYEDQLSNPEFMADCEQRVAKCRSDADPARITFEHDSQASGVIVRIEPDAAAKVEIAEAEEKQHHTNRAMLLSNWVMKSRDEGALAPTLSLNAAIELADELEAVQGNGAGFELFQQFRAASIVGVAALAAKFTSESDFRKRYEWIEDRILVGCTYPRSAQDEALLVDHAVLFNDPQLYGAEGLAALLNRGCGSSERRQLALGLATHRLANLSAALVGNLSWSADSDFVWRVIVASLDLSVIRWNRYWADNDRGKAAAEYDRHQRRAISAAIKTSAQLRAPRLPPHPYHNKVFWFRSWRRPIQVARVQAKYGLDWSRAIAILKTAPLAGIAQDQTRAGLFEGYLRGLIDWAYGYTEDVVANHFQNHHPFELTNAVARAMGAFAASCGNAELWRALCVFDRRDVDNLVAEYMEAVTAELIASGRPPDERFWSAWNPAASWALARLPPGEEDWDRYYRFTQAVAAAGFVGPYMTPIPPAWPHLEAILPTVDKWARQTAPSAHAAHALIRFAERLTENQMVQWLMPWLANYVEMHGRDEEFWQYGSLGDRAAALLKTLADQNTETRREVRRILAFIADSGSLGAREVLDNFAIIRR
jgi:hypothetical protein